VEEGHGRQAGLYPSADGMMHHECMVGIGGTALHWSKAVRDVPDTAQLHETVYERLAMESVRGRRRRERRATIKMMISRSRGKDFAPRAKSERIESIGIPIGLEF
jgi:hypothetical protein